MCYYIGKRHRMGEKSHDKSVKKTRENSREEKTCKFCCNSSYTEIYLLECSYYT